MSKSQPTINEKDLKERIAQGEKFKLVLDYEPELDMYSLFAKARGKLVEIHMWRGGIRRMRDPHRAISWAKKAGLTGVEFDHSFGN